MSQLRYIVLVIALLFTACSVAPADIAMTPSDQMSRTAPSPSDSPSETESAAASGLGTIAAETATEADVIDVNETNAASSAENDGPASAATQGDVEPQASIVVERAPLDQAARDDYFDVAGQAHAVLLLDTMHQVTIERTLRSDGLFDLSSQATVVIDEINGTSSADVTFTGSTWELARSGELSTPPWRLSESTSGATELDPFRQASFFEVDDLLRGFGSLLSADNVVAQAGPGLFHFEVEHQELLSWTYGGSVSPWTSVRFVDEALDGRSVEGVTPMIATFVGGTLQRLEIDYGPLLAAAVQADASLAFVDATFLETWEIRYPQAEALTQAGYSAGQCFNGEQLPDAREASTPCSEPHLYEIITVSSAGFGPDDDYPSQAELSDVLLPFCEDAFEIITGHDYRASLFGISSRPPSPGEWQRGERDFACYVRLREPTVGQLASLDVHRIGDRVSLAGMQVGDCVNGFETPEVSNELVDCGVEHEGQVYLVTTIDRDGPRPSYDWFNELAVERCGGALGTLQVQNAIDVNAESLSVRRLIPSDGMWDAGERFLVCVAVSDRPLRGSMVVGG